MKDKTIRIIFFILFAAAFHQYPCFAVDGSGNIKKEQRIVTGFDQLDFDLPGVYYIYQGQTESIEIEADDNILPYINTEISGHKLQVYRKWFSHLSPSKAMIFRIHVKSLSSLEASGQVNIHSPGITTDTLEIELSGSSTLVFDRLEGNRLMMEMSGSSHTEFNGGRVENFEIEMSGSGVNQSDNMQVDQATVHMSGSGKVSLWVKKYLEVDISGSGRLALYGKPKISSDISGSGAIENLGIK